MKCVNPRRLPIKGSEPVQYIQVSCGKCYPCLANRRRNWLFRLQNEVTSSLFALFVTFTYDDDHCPEILTKHDLQKFFKKLRHYEDFTYYAIGEYGTHTHRPHYHAVIFFKSQSDDMDLFDYYELVQSKWQFGFCAVARVSYRRLNYVLHYHVRPKIVDGRPTFSLFSKGMGVDFLTPQMIGYLMDTKAKTIHDFNGNLYVIPRYYRKKLGNMWSVSPQGVVDTTPFDAPFDEEHPYKEALERAFHKPIYSIPSRTVALWFKDRIAQSYRKLNKYNNQDKYI